MGEIPGYPDSALFMKNAVAIILIKSSHFYLGHESWDKNRETASFHSPCTGKNFMEGHFYLI